MKVLAFTFCAKDYMRCFLVVCLFSVLLLPGCRKKSTAEPIEIISKKSQPIVRALLFNDVKQFDLNCDTDITVTSELAKLNKAVFSKSEKQIKIAFDNGAISIGHWLCRAGQIDIVPDGNSIFSINGKKYRGYLRVHVDNDSNALDVINVIEIEKYLAGVVGAEMPSYWEAAALEAQAIASRTYCLYIKKRFGSGRNWDVRRTAANQVYNGVSAESKQVWQALGKTAGQVLFCKGDDGDDGIFPAYYSSTCGGHTETSKNVFGDEFESLQPVECKYCKGIAKKKWLNWSEVIIPKTKVNDQLMARYPQLKKLEKITKISIEKKSEHKGLVRISWVRLTGRNGESDVVRGEDFRLAVDPTGFKIKSNSFEIKDGGNSWGFSGRGLGHGVGMCQCGAQGMARKGKSGEEILSHYYPGSKIKELY